MLQFCKAKVEDAMALAQLDYETGTTTYSGVLSESAMAERATIEERVPRFQERLLDPEMAVFVATHCSGNLIGYVRAGTNRGDFSEEYTGKVYALYVREAWQRQGIGRRLFRDAMEWLITNGHNSVCLRVYGDLPSKAFYVRIGGKLIEYKEEGGAVPLSVYGWNNLTTVCALAMNDAIR